MAVLPSGGLFGKKKDDKDKENRDANITHEQNGTESESQLNSSAESEKTPKDKKERSKVCIHFVPSKLLKLLYKCIEKKARLD